MRGAGGFEPTSNLARYGSGYCRTTQGLSSTADRHTDFL